MSNLGPEAQKLIQAGKGAFRATAADQERIAQSLKARIGAGAGLSNAPAAAATKAQALGLGWPALSAVVVGLAAGGVFIASSFRSEKAMQSSLAPSVSVVTPAAAPPPAPLAPTAPSVAESDELPETASTLEKRAPAEDTPASSRQKAADRLAEEVQILSRAQTELHAGHFGETLRVLEDHARKFPRGTLAQERRATRIQALCGMGRMKEAEAELARLTPGSVHEGRARQACAAKRKSTAN